MPAWDQPRFLVASDSPLLIAALEPPLIAARGRVVVECSVESALEAMIGPPVPALVFLDGDLPGLHPSRTLEVSRVGMPGRTFPIVLIADNVQPEWIEQLAEGFIDDVIPKTVKSPFWRPRLDVILRTFHRTRELEQLCVTGVFDSGNDPVTGILNRAAMLSLLFRETDRVQRMNTSLSLILFSICDFDDGNTRFRAMAHDHFLAGVARRVQHLLRSYDLFGCVDRDQFLLGLPGCHTDHAIAFTQRMRHEVFSRPFCFNGRDVHLSGCFAVASSHGRSPIVVLRNAEKALRRAMAAGSGSIECADDCLPPQLRLTRDRGILT